MNIKSMSAPADPPHPLCGSAVAGWPQPPIAAGRLLIPITSWAEMWDEARVTGVGIDAHWLFNVEAGVAYFFRWVGEPRATALVVWDGCTVPYVECHGKGDRRLAASESVEILHEVNRLFADAGYEVFAGVHA